MNKRNAVSNRASLAAAVLSLAIVCVLVVKTSGQGDEGGQPTAIEQWEYLAVAGPSTSNLSATGNPHIRKEPNAPFGREAFVLEPAD